MRQGALFIDKETGRFDIRFDIEYYYGGLHCGDCLDVCVGNEWNPTRIEMDMNQKWYLVGIRTHDLNGLQVRM